MQSLQIPEFSEATFVENTYALVLIGHAFLDALMLLVTIR
jgi:hypothetical protein